MQIAYSKNADVRESVSVNDNAENIDNENKEENQKDESSKMNFGTVKKILFWWSITLPTAFGFSALLTWIFIQI